MKLGLISLGCAKNLIDSELFLGVATKYGIHLTNNIKEADIIVINTCGFIESAKKEAIDTILEVTENKKEKTVIVMGCLVERYLDDLKSSIPEVDIYFPIRDYSHIDALFAKLTKSNQSYAFDYQNRIVTTLPHSAYLRISEGCNNHCSYCAIPLIRGSFQSRPFDSLILEAESLVKKGVKEITLIGQDTTRYGTDLTGGKLLPELLHTISLINGVEIVRVLYLYPDEITEDCIEEIASNPKIANYFDIPIQHASNKILHAMNRRGDKDFLDRLITKIRDRIPDAIIRTTLIVGFPGESEQDFQELQNFIKEKRFDRLGVFTYSDEEDTKGFEMTPKIPQNVMNTRLDTIMEIQRKIAKEKNTASIGNCYSAIVDQYDIQKKAYVVRNYAYAPDDVDGNIYIYTKQLPTIHPGDMIKIQITDANEYDLTAKIVDK